MKESSLSDGWRQLPDYPGKLGVAGVLAGTHDDVLIAAGGANFPDAPPWEAGVKKFYDEIHGWKLMEESWQSAGRLPAPRGYAAVVSLPEGVLVLGGETDKVIYADSFWLRWEGGQVVTSPGPALPVAMSSPVAVVAGDYIYLAPGYGEGNPRTVLAGFWRWNLRDRAAGWQELPVWPGPSRGQAVMAAVAEDVFLCSGIGLVADLDGSCTTTYLVDGYRFSPVTGWKRLPDLPRSAIAAPTPAPVSEHPTRVYVLGGVDGRLVGKLPRTTRVPGDILYFDLETETWCPGDGPWPCPVVTTPAVRMDGRWIFVSGEISAGVRTPHVWSWGLESRPVESTTSASL